MRGEGGKYGEPRTRQMIRRSGEIDYSLAKYDHTDVIRCVASEALNTNNTVSEFQYEREQAECPHCRSWSGIVR